jgi:3-methyladenine DNA glycosylase AlkD
MKIECLRKELHLKADDKKAKVLKSFFKTGPGQYAAGDLFIGVTVPQIRGIAKKFRDISLKEVISLLRSPIHEERLAALIILVLQYSGGDASKREKIYKVYRGNAKYINNWDLVDLTAAKIVGHFLSDKDRAALYELAVSGSLWERRIAIVATFYFIKSNQFNDTLKISRLLLSDEHDLIHKAVGWMLREVGKRDMAVAETFLKKYYRLMPRTMLRYAIERFPVKKRRAYLFGRT